MMYCICHDFSCRSPSQNEFLCDLGLNLSTEGENLRVGVGHSDCSFASELVSVDSGASSISSRSYSDLFNPTDLALFISVRSFPWNGIRDCDF